MLQNNYARKYFANYLREIRLKLHLSVKDTAELIGIYPTRLSDYEHGKHVPTVQTMRKIISSFKTLGVDEDTLSTLNEKHEYAINSSNNRVVGRIRREIG